MKGGCLYGDWVKEADTTVVLTQEDANFPAENVKTEEAAVTARTISGQITEIRLQITFATTHAPRIFALINHNLAGGDDRY